jgi:predicted GIY-YIG superfamily endonuclease
MLGRNAFHREEKGKRWTHPRGCQQVTHFEVLQDVEQHLVRQV